MRKSFSPQPPNKNFLCVCNKKFLMEICRNIKTFAFQVLWKCIFWVHRNGAVQVFYLTPTRNSFPGKFVKWVRFLAMLLEYILYNVELSKVCRMKFFEKNFIVLLSCLRLIWITNSSDHRRVWMNCESLVYKVVT